MIELVLSVFAVLIVLLFGRLGRGAGAFGALGQFFTALVAVLIGLRAWFYASHSLSILQSSSLPVLAVGVFWIIIAVFALMFMKLRETYTEVFESVHSSFLDQAIGFIFGLGTGAIMATGVVMSASILALQFWPDFQADKLPLPLDRAPLAAYRFLEANVARVSPTDLGHTPLPSLKRQDVQNPAVFWE